MVGERRGGLRAVYSKVHMEIEERESCSPALV